MAKLQVGQNWPRTMNVVKRHIPAFILLFWQIIIIYDKGWFSKFSASISTYDSEFIRPRMDTIDVILFASESTYIIIDPSPNWRLWKLGLFFSQVRPIMPKTIGSVKINFLFSSENVSFQGDTKGMCFFNKFQFKYLSCIVNDRRAVD